MRPPLHLFWLFFWSFLGSLNAAPNPGPALDVALHQPQPELPGPSSRRSGITISEVFHAPPTRPDGLSVQFIELFNSLPWFEDLSGWQIRGAVQFSFPSNTFLPARSYLVVAVNPSDLKQAYSFATNCFGPFVNNESLPRRQGKLQVWNRNGGLCFELDYRDQDPWPVANQGTGHSLVLARPTLGERNPAAWAASAESGGSPGLPDPLPSLAPKAIRINEVFATSTPPDSDFVELYNYSESPMDLSEWSLSDDPSTLRFRFPTNTVLSARGFLTLDSQQLGFSLASSGERLFLRSPDQRVVDSVRYPSQLPGFSWGRFPDGSSQLQFLSSRTPSLPNSSPQPSTVVLNEVMYHPPSDDDADEFIELHNPSPNSIDLANWQLQDAIQFTFPTNSILAAGGYIVVAKDVDRLKSNYPSLDPNRIAGAYQGSLGNSGERVALAQPISIVTTNQAGIVSISTRHVVVDEVTYGTGGRWGKWSDGGGSSLERKDPRADGRLAPNWADSDESKKSPWTTVEFTGRLDNGNGSANPLQILSIGAGEFLLDNVELSVQGSTNRVINPTFEGGTNSWVAQGNHNGTTLETTEGDASAQSLHVRATGPGNTGANRIYGRLYSALSANQTATLRARVRWLKGSPNILLRIHGNWLEAPGWILATKNLGTPGAQNSRFVPNAPPAITDVTHFPVLPAANQAVRVIARVSDRDGLSKVSLLYRRDTTTNLTEVAMEDNGAGLYSAMIPGQVTASLVAFHVVASDNSDQPAQSKFPDNAPVRECLVRWGEAAGNIPLGPYRIWATRDTISKWIRRERLSNDPLDSTFVCGNYRVIYNAGAQYSGSPFHSPGFDSPTGANCDYLATMPPDDPFLGEFELNLLQPGNGGGDTTCQQEQQAYWIARELGLPYSHRRPVQVFVNGVRRGIVFEDAQQPNSDYVQQWFHDDPDGDLHKIQLWFEFEVDASTFQAIGADLGRYVTTGNAKKTARYRWTFPRRSYGNEPNNYTNLFNLVEVVNTNVAGDRYLRALQHSVDVDNWFRTHITEHIVGNNDSYSYGGGQNMYTYRPSQGRWKLLIWDIDFAFASQGPTTDLFNTGGANIGPRNDVPAFARIYWQGIIDAVQGPLTAERYGPIIDSRYNGMRTSGAAVTAGTSIKTFLSQRRSYILSLLKSNNAPLRITTNSGTNYVTDSSMITIAGTAPLEARELRINGYPLQLTWTTKTAWTARFALQPGTNSLQLGGLDFRGQPLTNDPVFIQIVSTATPESPIGKVVFNELMHHPQLDPAGFVELKNLSLNTGFDVSGWRIEGLQFTFPPGTFLEPNGYLVIANDSREFASTYGTALRVAGQYSGRLSRVGETLRLIRPATQNSPETEIDSVTYRTTPPWPSAANAGASLQLIDASQENNRPGNWSAAPPNLARFTPGAQNSVAAFLPTLPPVWLNEIQPINLTGILDASGKREPWVELYNSGDSEISLAGLYLGDNPAQPNTWPFPADAKLAPHQYAIVWLDGEPAQSTPTEWHANFRADIDKGIVLLSLADGGRSIVLDALQYTPISGERSVGYFPDGDPNSLRLLGQATPRLANSLSLPRYPIWINEWMSDNATVLRDPADRDFEDWFELYNAGDFPIDLTGFLLSDSRTNATPFEIPTGYILPAKGRLLVWADGEPGQNRPDLADLHVDFKLSAGGESIVLRAPDGTLIDAVDFGPQAIDQSHGRSPDGGNIIVEQRIPTPGKLNVGGRPNIRTVTSTQEGLAIEWDTIPGTQYIVERWADFGPDSVPENASGILTAKGALLRFVATTGDATSAFYRIRQLP